MSNETALVAYEKKDVVAAFSDGLNPFIERIKKEALSIIPDISTQEGRKAVASMAHKIARTKTTIDEVGKELKAEAKAKCDSIDAERRKAWDELQALQDQVRKPLSDWENLEKTRVDAHEKAIQDLAAWKNWAISNAAGTRSSQDELKNALAKSKEIMEGRDWQEFSYRAAMQFTENETALNAALAERVKVDELEAENVRLRKEEEARLQKERDEQIAAEAAAKAKQEAEEKAAKEAEAAAEKAKQEQDRVEAEAIAANAKATLEAARAQEAEHNELAALSQGFHDRLKAEEDAKRREAAAAQKVLDDAAKAKQEAEAETAKREADKNHKKKINNEAKTALVKIMTNNPGGGGSNHLEKLAEILVIAIAKSEVPNVTIKY